MKLIYFVAAILAIHSTECLKVHKKHHKFSDLPECPEDPTSENIYFPVPGDCSSFYECSNGVPIKMPCPPGQEWAAEFNRCDLPEVAQCSGTTGVTTPATEGTTVDPSIKCPPENPEGHDVFFPVPGDCTSFYKCNNGVPVKIACPPDQEWSQELERCDWPEIAQCSVSAGTTVATKPTTGGTTVDPSIKCPSENPEGHDVFFPVPGECNSFYKCYNGVPVKIPCPPGQEWSQELERCDWPEIAKCSVSTGTTSATKPTTLDPSIKCPSENPEGHDVFFPVPGDCNSFYKCYNGVPVQIPCPPGQEWSQELERCDWPEIAQCSTSQKPTQATTHKPTTPPPVDCPSDNPGGEPIFLPAPGDCSSFYQCDHGIPVKMSCPSGQEWSQELQRCDWPEIAKCSVQSNDDEIDCPLEDPEDDVLYPVPGDCTSFYKCNNGKPVKSSCPPGLHWSQELRRCDWPSVANCVDTRGKIGRNYGSRKILPNGCPEENGQYDVLLTISGNCTHFLQCDYGATILKECPPGTEWFDMMKRCDFPHYAKCSENNSLDTRRRIGRNYGSRKILPNGCPEENGQYDVLITIPGNCTHFLQCDYGVTILKECPPGTEWFDMMKRCDFPHYAKCSANNRF